MTVTLWGLALACAGFTLAVAAPLGTPTFYAGLVLVNLGIVHDACDGEVARYRIHHGLQNVKTYRVGMFADFWAFAVLVQALLPLMLGLIAWRAGGPWFLGALGGAAAFALLASYVAGFGRSAYWPAPTAAAPGSFSFAQGAAPAVQGVRRLYFWIFETAMFAAHASIVLVAWSIVGGIPAWALLYVGGVGAVILAAFVFATALTLHRFDRWTA